MITTTTERGLLAACKKRGLMLCKSEHLPNDEDVFLDFGGYRILDLYSGEILEGEYFDLTPEDVRSYLNSYDNEQ